VRLQGNWITRNYFQNSFMENWETRAPGSFSKHPASPKYWQRYWRVFPFQLPEPYGELVSQKSKKKKSSVSVDH